MAASDVIEKVVILFLENHTYDNLASDVVGGDGDLTLAIAPDVVAADPGHGHPPWMVRNQPPPNGARRLRYTRPQVPILYSLMDAFSVCDRYFSDVASMSLPNHAFAIGADAEGAYANPGKHYQPIIATPGLPARLVAAGKTWANYGRGFAFPQYADPTMHQHRYDSAQFLTDAAANTLPDVSWVYAPAHRDFHPGDPNAAYDDGSSMADSDAWLGSAMNALLASHLADGRPLWDHVAVFVTFDDWGGWSDHVNPPVVETFPANHPLYPNDPYRYGSRVPCAVVSPYAKAQHVSHDVGSHTSIVAFIERLWGLPPSPAPAAAVRTTAATELALADCFDFTQAPIPVPVIPPAARVPAPAKKKVAKKKVAKKR